MVLESDFDLIFLKTCTCRYDVVSHRAFFKDFSLGDQMILAIHLSAPAPIISIWLRRSHIVPEQISYCAWTNFRDFENTSKSSLYFWKVDSHGAIILLQIKKKYFGNNFNNWFFKCWFCIFGCESTRGYLTPSFKFTIMTVIARCTKLTTLLKMFTVMMRHNIISTCTAMANNLRSPCMNAIDNSAMP